MKKLIATALLAVIGITGFAQEKAEKPERPEKKERPERHDRSGRDQMAKFTPEQRNQLMLKKMTLELDLNASQQKEIGKMIAEQNEKREAFMKNRKDKTTKPTSDELFEMRSKMLDEQIAMKQKIKKTLSPEQFQKWEEIKKQHHEGIKRHFKHRMAQNMNRKDGDFKRAHSQGLKKDMDHKKEEGTK
ncbi:MAG TPA: hypothetical protein VL859_13165 [Flavobacterium sp.]|nr:hypothetical protein [Flavobacterium sp.]